MTKIYLKKEDNGAEDEKPKHEEVIASAAEHWEPRRFYIIIADRHLANLEKETGRAALAQFLGAQDFVLLELGRWGGWECADATPRIEAARPYFHPLSLALEGVTAKRASVGELPIIHRITRADLIADGTLIDLSSGELAPLVREAGIKIPLAMTCEAYADYVALTPSAEAAGCDEKGRLWDILMSVVRVSRTAKAGEHEKEVSFLSVSQFDKPTLAKLKLVIGPGDEGEPVFTLLLPNQD